MSEIANHEDLLTLTQQHFTDGLVLVIGSGLSAAEGVPGMAPLADHLKAHARSLGGAEAELWAPIETALDANEGLEGALLKHPPNENLELWIARRTAELLMAAERDIIAAVVRGERILRLTKLLDRILKPAPGLPILTPNYDRLIEVACELAGFHVDTTATGIYAGEFDHLRSCMASCRGISTRAKRTVLEHFPRAIVLKPHGSFDWYRSGDEVRRCSLDLDAERLIITPGLGKYRAGYNAPFDKHRDLANDHIKRAAKLFVVGYGFNDDHLQTHLLKKIRDGTPTLVLARTAREVLLELSASAPKCICLTKPKGVAGVVVRQRGHEFHQPGPDLWDLGFFTEELLT